MTPALPFIHIYVRKTLILNTFVKNQISVWNEADGRRRLVTVMSHLGKEKALKGLSAVPDLFQSNILILLRDLR